MTFIEILAFLKWHIIATVLWMAYIIVYSRNKGKLPQRVIWWGGIVLLVAWLLGIAECTDEHAKVQNEREYAALDDGLKQYFNDKTVELSSKKHEESTSDDAFDRITGDNWSEAYDSIVAEHNRYQGYLNYDKDLDGKFIGIVRNVEGNTVLEYRLNKELKKHNQYTTNPDSLDYVVVLLPYWSTDYYGEGYNHSSSTEMGTAYVLDYKADSIVKIIEFDTNKNPYGISVKKGGSNTHYTQELEGEELYIGIIKARKEVRDTSY